MKLYQLHMEVLNLRLAQRKIIMPFKKYIDKYNKIVKPAFHKITKNINQNEYLSNLRDVLLPKLLSGEIRLLVNDKKGDK